MERVSMTTMKPAHHRYDDVIEEPIADSNNHDRRVKFHPNGGSGGGTSVLQRASLFETQRITTTPTKSFVSAFSPSHSVTAMGSRMNSNHNHPSLAISSSPPIGIQQQQQQQQPSVQPSFAFIPLTSPVNSHVSVGDGSSSCSPIPKTQMQQQQQLPPIHKDRYTSDLGNHSKAVPSSSFRNPPPPPPPPPVNGGPLVHHMAQQLAKSSIGYATSPKAKALHFTGSKMFVAAKKTTNPGNNSNTATPRRLQHPPSSSSLPDPQAVSEASMKQAGFTSTKLDGDDPPAQFPISTEQNEDGDSQEELNSSYSENFAVEENIEIEEIPNDDYEPTEKCEEVEQVQQQNDVLSYDEDFHVEPEQPESVETLPPGTTSYSHHDHFKRDEGLMNNVDHSVDKALPSLPPPPPPPPILSPITPRLSNMSTVAGNEEKIAASPQQQQQQVRSNKKKKKLASEVESDWSSDAVSAVSSSVNLAIDKLKSLAQPYYYQQPGENASSNYEETPDAINTSADVSADEQLSSANNSNPSNSAETDSSSNEPEASGLDMKALEMELRAKSQEFVGMTGPDENRQDVADPEDNSQQCLDPTPQKTVQTSSNTFFVQQQPLPKVKEEKLYSDRVIDPNGSLTLSTIGAPMMKQLEAVSRKGISALNGISVRDGTNPSKPSRSITPIMRMRSKAGEQLAAAMEEVSSPARRSHASSSNLDEGDYFALKQKRWKEKMKLVEEEREKERSVLNGDAESRNRRRRRKKKRGKRSKHSRHRSADDERSTFSNRSANTYAGLGECRNELSAMIGRLLRSQCGSLDDAFVDEDESTDDSDSESGDDETATEDQVSADADITSAASTTNNYKTIDSTRSKKNSGARQQSSPAIVTSPSESKISKNDEENLDATISHRNSNAAHPGYDLNRETKEKKGLDMKDKNFIRHFIAGATRTGTVLMLHEKNEGKNAFNRPTKHILFIQPGTLSKSGHYVGPSLVWKAMDSSLIGEVDLFDVSSLDKASARQLADYPVAMPGRSLFIRTNQGAEYVFEAKTEEQAVRFVHGMRWVIARLTFNLIIGNVSVSCELLDVERNNEVEDDDERIPRSPEEETQWAIAMNEVTSHLVDKASIV